MWDESELTTRKILAKLRDWGYLSDESKGLLAVYDDGYNYVVYRRGTYEPLLALEYGIFENHPG